MGESSAVLEAALRRLVRGAEPKATRATRAGETPSAPPRAVPAEPRSPVLAAAQRRLARDARSAAPTHLRAPASTAERAFGRPPLRPAAPRTAERRPVVTLEAPRRPVDARALATLLADDTANKLDQLCYVWSVIQELEPFAGAGEVSLRRRAAELLIVASKGDAEIPLAGPLRAVRSFLSTHGMQEEYVESLCSWYLDR